MRKLAVFSAAFAAATAAYVYGLGQAPAYWIAGACLALSALLRGLGLRRIGVVCLGVCAGLIWCMGYHQIWLGPVNRVCETQQVRTVRLLDQPESAEYGMWTDVKSSWRVAGMRRPYFWRRLYRNFRPEIRSRQL